jgi:hypothetical protein
MTTLPEIIGALVSDAFEISGWHGGSVAGTAITRYFRRRAEQARDILFEEMRQEKIFDVQAASEDDAIAVIVRYLRAAREGTARLNLRLLAKAIAGKLRSGNLVADEFLQYAEVLATLTRDEIILLGTMYRYLKAPPRTGFQDPWTLTLRELTGSGLEHEFIFTVAAKALRSGLLYPMFGAGGLGGGQYGALSFRVSPLFAELGETVDFDDALRRETSMRK